MSSFCLKPAIAQPPALLWEPRASITFRHPGYENPSDILFRLPRLDCSPARTSTSSRPPIESLAPVEADHESPTDTSLQEQGLNLRQASEVIGVHHRTALVACQIIANNAFGGYLATDREGDERVTVGDDGVLSAETYWFFANRSVDDLNLVRGRDVYPIVPSFQDWAFPHQHFATLRWETRCLSSQQESTSSASTSVARTMPLNSSATSSLTRLAPPPRPRPIVQRCILSNSAYALEKAHIIPAAQSRWFGDNVMATYGRGSRRVDDEGNKVLMRHDLHSVWDDHNFALVPKGGSFAVHVLNMPDAGLLEFAAAWHNVPVQKDALSHTAGEYLFAKFAQAVFMLLKPFIAQSTVHRFVARMRVQADDPRHGREVREEWASGNSLCESYSGGGSKSASPSTSRKRSRSQRSADRGNLGRDACHGEGQSREGTWYERNVRPALCASVSEDETGAGWYRTHVGDRNSDYEEDGEGEPRRGRGRKRRRCQQRQRSEHTVDTLPSLTDTSVVGPDDADRSFEDSSAPLLSSEMCTGGQDKHLANAKPTGGVYDQDPM